MQSSQMEGHSGKPLYLSIAPRFITNRGVFLLCEDVFRTLNLDASYPMWYKEDASEDSTP